jgi:hypothetical protein
VAGGAQGPGQCGAEKAAAAGNQKRHTRVVSRGGGLV